MAMLAMSAYVAVDRNVERRVCYDGRGGLVRHQRRPRRLQEGIAAKEQMISELPQLSGGDDCRSIADDDRGFVRLGEVEILNTKFDLDLGETCRLHVEVEFDLVELEENFLERLVVPFR